MNMTQTVYADILIVVNTYVNYALLRLAGLWSRRKAQRLRLFLSALFGGLYSLIILIDEIPDAAVAVTRIAACSVMLLIAFGYENRTVFFRSLGAFFLVNFVFAGLMLALWFLFAPRNMLFSNGVVYFDIDALTLIVLTVVCYAVSLCVNRLLRFRTPKNSVYDMEVFLAEERFSFRAFLDTGNCLTEPFSGYPVAVAAGDVLSDGGKTLPDCVTEYSLPVRAVPCSSVNGGGVLTALKPEKIHIKGAAVDFYTDEVFLALTDGKIKNGEYTALIGTAVFENRTNETEEDYV